MTTEEKVANLEKEVKELKELLNRLIEDYITHDDEYEKYTVNKRRRNILGESSK